MFKPTYDHVFDAIRCEGDRRPLANNSTMTESDDG